MHQPFAHKEPKRTPHNEQIEFPQKPTQSIVMCSSPLQLPPCRRQRRYIIAQQILANAQPTVLEALLHIDAAHVHQKVRMVRGGRCRAAQRAHIVHAKLELVRHEEAHHVQLATDQPGDAQRLRMVAATPQHHVEQDGGQELAQPLVDAVHDGVLREEALRIELHVLRRIETAEADALAQSLGPGDGVEAARRVVVDDEAGRTSYEGG